MAIKIFYSWQSDLPNKTNRGFIKKALDNVAELINGDIESADREEIEIDTATKNVRGTVNIADTILKKINECDVFVADISIVGKIDSYNKENDGKRKERRKTPNPNVLFELGYAWKKLGEGKIISVMNTAYGRFEDLPFDLRGKTVISYGVTKNVEEKVLERKNLEKSLENAIRLIIEEDTLQGNIAGKPQTDEVDSFLLEIQNIEAQKEYKKFREEWFNSKQALEDVLESLNSIFFWMDEKFFSNSKIYSSQGIQLVSSEYSKSIENAEIASRVELKNYETSSRVIETPYRIFLEIRLFNKNSFWAESRNPDDTIEEFLLYPDINFERQVIWQDLRDETITFTVEEIVDKAFKLFVNQIKNPAPTVGEKSRTMLNALKTNDKLKKDKFW